MSSVKLIALIFVFGVVAQEVHSQYLGGWPYAWPAYGYLPYYGKRSAGFDSNAAVTGSTPVPTVNAYPSGLKFEASTTHAPQNLNVESTSGSSTIQPTAVAKH